MNVNVTFYVACSFDKRFREWVGSSLIKAVKNSFQDGNARLFRVMHDIQPDALTYAFQFDAGDEAQAQQWVETDFPELIDTERMAWGENILHFVTLLKPEKI